MRLIFNYCSYYFLTCKGTHKNTEDLMSCCFMKIKT